MTQTASKLALLVQCEESYGTLEMKAYVVIPQENGELHHPQWSYGGHDFGAEFYGFEASCYVGHSDYIAAQQDREDPLWGFGCYFKPHRVESVRQARAIASVLGKLDKGMDAINASEGYIGNGDFATYALRVARVLKLTGGVYVRNTKEAQARSGETYRKVDGAGLQYWVNDKAQLVRDGKKRDVLA